MGVVVAIGAQVMQGEKVIVRAFKGEPLVRLIWEVYPDVVGICDEAGYQKLLMGEPWMPIGFPRRDVFRYDPGVAERLMTEWQVDPSIWDSLSMWTDDAEPTSPQYGDGRDDAVCEGHGQVGNPTAG